MSTSSFTNMGQGTLTEFELLLKLKLKLRDNLFKYLPKALPCFLPVRFKLDVFPLLLISAIPTLSSKCRKTTLAYQGLKEDAFGDNV